MTVRRGLSGIYFRSETEDGFEPVAFEDLPEDEQERVMTDRDADWLRSLAKQLGATIRKLGDQFDIARDDRG